MSSEDVWGFGFLFLLNLNNLNKFCIFLSPSKRPKKKKKTWKGNKLLKILLSDGFLANPARVTLSCVVSQVQDCACGTWLVWGPQHGLLLACPRYKLHRACAVQEPWAPTEVLSNLYARYFSPAPRLAGLHDNGYLACDKYQGFFPFLPLVFNGQLSASRKAVFRLHWKQVPIRLADARVVYFPF